MVNVSRKSGLGARGIEWTGMRRGFGNWSSRALGKVKC